MKKLLILLILLLVSLLFKGSVSAQSLLSQTGSPAARVSSEDKVTDLKQRANTEITRRITFLNELLTKIDAAKKITDADKANLKTQIQEQITGLTSLQAKIETDTDLTTLRTDVKSIVNGYYIFAFFRVKISLLFAADRLSVTTDLLANIYNKLEKRVTEAETQGKDVTSLKTLLLDMASKIETAKEQYDAAEEALVGATASGYPGNKSSLLDARTKIRTAGSNLRTAYQDAIKIRQGLGDLKENLREKTGTPSAKTPQGI